MQLPGLKGSVANILAPGTTWTLVESMLQWFKAVLAVRGRTTQYLAGGCNVKPNRCIFITGAPQGNTKEGPLDLLPSAEVQGIFQEW